MKLKNFARKELLFFIKKKSSVSYSSEKWWLALI